MNRKRQEQRKVVHDSVEHQLPPDLALLLNAVRSEFDAKLDRLWWKLLASGVPLGAVGGFVAEWIKPGAVADAIAALPLM